MSKYVGRRRVSNQDKKVLNTKAQPPSCCGEALPSRPEEDTGPVEWNWGAASVKNNSLL